MVFLDFFVSRGFKNVGSLVVFFVVAFAFWVGRHGELDFDVSIICVVIIILKRIEKKRLQAFLFWEKDFWSQRREKNTLQKFARV